MTTDDHVLGPESGHVRLRTTREGMAAKVGHDLVLDLPLWSGTLTMDPDDPAGAKLSAEIDLASLTVVEGTGGVSPLSADDKAEITKTALKLLDVARNPTAAFTAEQITADGGESGTIEGSLSLHGTTGPVRLKVTKSGNSSWRATGSLRQSEFGIKPYKAFLGALRLSDTVAIEVALELHPSPESTP